MMADFSRLRDRNPDDPALILPGASPVTYRQLDRMAEDWRADLVAMAHGRRPVVALEFATTPDAIAAYLGALRAELPLLLVEPGQLGPDTVLRRVWHPEIRIATTAGALRIYRDDTPAHGLPEPHPDLALLLSTSGSTGDPKLVRLSRRNIASNASAIAEYLALTPADRAMTTLPLFYSYGLSVLNSYLAAGAALILTERSVTEPAFWEAFRTHHATSLALVPHQFDLLDRSGFAARPLPSLRYITQAGGKLAPDSVRRFDALGKAAGWDLVLMYGQTEAAPRISFVPPAALPQAADTIGQPIPGGRLRIIDETGAEITRPGLAGELVYDGPNVMMGYAETRADLARGAEVSDLRTGDIAERTADGLYRIVGRMKRFVKIFGLRLSLDQIEALLHDRGIAAQAVAVDDRLVLLHAEADDGPAARKAVADAYDLPPAEIRVGHLPELPLLASGKPDHKALRALAAEVLRIEAARPKPAGQSLAEVLRQATRSASVGPQDSFTSLGGDSLSYLQMQMALEERFGQAPAGWEAMPLAQLEALSAPSGFRPGWSPVGIDVLLRIVAISFVVVQHATTYRLYGGVWILIALMGFSAARFQMQLIAEGQALRLGMRMLYPILPLYYLLLFTYELLRDDAPMTSYLLFADYAPINGSLLTVYWFISFFAKVVAILMLFAAVPLARNQLVRHPWTTPAVASVVLLSLQAVLLAQGDYVTDHRSAWPWLHYTTHGFIECLPFFLAGWMMQQMKGRGQVAATAGLAVVMLGLFSQFGTGMTTIVLLGAGLALMAINPKVTLPTRAARLLQNLASVTLFVYLLHQIVITPFFSVDLPQWVEAGSALVLAFALAFVAKRAFESIDQAVTEFVGRGVRLRAQSSSR